MGAAGRASMTAALRGRPLPVIARIDSGRVLLDLRSVDPEEDAAVLARCLAKIPEDPAAALRNYEGLRRSRTARVVRHARRLGKIYHLSGPAAMMRNLTLIAAGGQELLASYDWLYDWRMR